MVETILVPTDGSVHAVPINSALRLAVQRLISGSRVMRNSKIGATIACAVIHRVITVFDYRGKHRHHPETGCTRY